MTALILLGAFLVFLAAIAAVNAIDGYAGERFGYLPFALPNIAFMLIPHAALALVMTSSGPQLVGAGIWASAVLAAAASLGMFLVLRARTNGWIATAATLAMLFAAPVLLFSTLFRGIAGGDRTPD